jgi:hypothetical protein
MEVWVLQYVSGYTSEAWVKLFNKEEDARKEFLELVKLDYSNEELTTEEVLGYLERGEDYDGDDGDVNISLNEITWDGPEVYECYSYYKQEVL